MKPATPASADSAISEVPFNPLNFKRAASVLRALNHPLRLRLLKTIYREGRVCVSDLQKDLEQTQAITSVHLSELRRAGFVRVEKTGRSRWYSVNTARLQEVQQLITEYMIMACFLLCMRL